MYVRTVHLCSQPPHPMKKRRQYKPVGKGGRLEGLKKFHYILLETLETGFASDRFIVACSLAHGLSAALLPLQITTTGKKAKLGRTHRQHQDIALATMQGEGQHCHNSVYASNEV